MYVGSDRPTLKDLHKYVVNEAALKWRDLGLELLPYERYGVLDNIEASSPCNAAKCCWSVFQKWLMTTEDASWNQLIRALRSVQLNDLADRLEQMIIREGELYSTCRQSQVQHVAIILLWVYRLRNVDTLWCL